MSDSQKAIFLSYASSDAAAAQKICAALRTAGVEVWFDQSELTGGDAWDQKIRRQVRDCELFLPVISAATQARRESYFRLEWKLADDRTHLMAKGTPFLVPVCIDETKDADALVPDSFTAVQWTRLPGGETPEKFCARVKALLAGESPGVGQGRPTPPSSDAHSKPAGSGNPALKQSTRRAPIALWAIAAVGLALIAFIALRPRHSPEDVAQLVAKAQSIAANAAAKSSPAPAPATALVWPRDSELKRAIALIDGLDATREDFRLAEEMAKRAVERNASDPEAVTVFARVHSGFLHRNFDFTNERGAQAKRYGERAVQLALDEPEAHYALALFLHYRARDFARAETHARRAVELGPSEPRFARLLMRTVIAQRPGEGFAMGQDVVRRFPRDALSHYDLSIEYRNRGDLAQFEREIDATLALTPLSGAINWKARLAFWSGDLPTMRQWLDQLPARARAEERAVISYVIWSLSSGSWEFGLSTLSTYTETWLFDANTYTGPTALLQAMLLAQQGKAGLARVQYEAALVELAHRRKENPSDQTTRNSEVWIMLGLGRTEEARALHHTDVESLRRPFRVLMTSVWWYGPIPRSLLVGDRETALQLIREGASEAEGRKWIRRQLQTDVRMVPFRDDPQITALLADPK